VRISKNGSAHHTVPSKFNDKILFWNNKSPIDFWCLFDLKTKKTISLKKMWRAQKSVSTPPASPPAKKRWRSRWNLNAWKRPTGWVKSQCRQRAKKVSTHVSALRGVLVRNGNKGIVRLPGRPYRYQKGPGGLTKPCVSPNGRYVSYFVKTGVLEVVEMRVAKIR
jgi:hypothetical protein